MGDDSLQATLTHWVTLRQPWTSWWGTISPQVSQLGLPRLRPTQGLEWLRQRAGSCSPGVTSYLSAQDHMEMPHLTEQASQDLRPCDL